MQRALRLDVEPPAQVDLQQVESLAASRRGLLWLDLLDPTEGELTWLQGAFGFHPLAIEDCRHFNQRVKLEEYDDHLFLAMHFPRREDKRTELTSDELHVFLGPSFLVTVHQAAMAALEEVWRRLEREPRRFETGPDFLFYLLIDRLVDSFFPVLDAMDDWIDTLEQRVIRRTRATAMHEIFVLQRNLLFLRRASGPLREVLHTLAFRDHDLVDRKSAFYYRDAYDHLIRIHDTTEIQRDLLANVLDVYLSITSNRLNESIKRLTVVATVFLPLSFIVGFGGMNFKHIPFDNPLAFVLTLLLIAATPGAMYVLFRWRGWI